MVRYPLAEDHDPLQSLLREVERPKAGRARWASAVVRELERRIAGVAETAARYGARKDAMVRPSYPPELLGGGVERARREGERFKQTTLARPEMLPPEAAAARAGLSRQALDDRRKKGRALALSHVKRGFRYPAWQFDDNVAASVPQVLAELRHLDAWRKYVFLVEPEPLLDEATPLDVLRAGRLERVLQVARVLREDGIG